MKQPLSVMFSTWTRFKKDKRPLSEHLPDMVGSYRNRLDLDPKVLIIRTDEAEALNMGEVIRVYIFEDDWIELKVERYEKRNLQPNNYVLCQVPQDFLANGGTTNVS